MNKNNHIIMNIGELRLRIYYEYEAAEPETGFPETVHIYNLQAKLCNEHGSIEWVDVKDLLMETGWYDEALIVEKLLEQNLP